MVDVVDAATRSRMMAGIKSRDTKPETVIRSGLHARGLRYRLTTTGVPGKPDVVLPKWRTVVLVHGCFWHWHGCALSKIPATNVGFWKSKLETNQRRDQEVKRMLVADGWRVAVVWECATRSARAREDLPRLLDSLATWIRDPAQSTTLELPAPTARTTATTAKK